MTAIVKTETHSMMVFQVLFEPEVIPTEPLAIAGIFCTIAGVAVIIAAVRQSAETSPVRTVATITIPAAIAYLALVTVPALRWPLYIVAIVIAVYVPVSTALDTLAIISTIEEE